MKQKKQIKFSQLLSRAKRDDKYNKPYLEQFKPVGQTKNEEEHINKMVETTKEIRQQKKDAGERSFSQDTTKDN